jgi:hypothetical protein
MRPIRTSKSGVNWYLMFAHSTSGRNLFGEILLCHELQHGRQLRGDIGGELGAEAAVDVRAPALAVTGAVGLGFGRHKVRLAFAGVHHAQGAEGVEYEHRRIGVRAVSVAPGRIADGQQRQCAGGNRGAQQWVHQSTTFK